MFHVEAVRKRTYEIIEKTRDRDAASLLFDCFILSLICLNVAAAILSFNDSIAKEYFFILKVIENVSIVIFTIEYLLRLWTAKLKFSEAKHPYFKFIFSFLGIADLLVLLPFYLPFVMVVDLRYLRLFRFFRIFVKVVRTIITSEKEKRFIRQAFSTYLSSSVVAELIADPSKLNLGGEKREMTALFTDIKSFSTISENIDPTHLVQILNKYLTAMSNIIMENHGTIDKFIGDAIVAFFGAPIYREDHAMQACVSALAMKKVEAELNTQLLAEGLSTTPLFTRIGVNTGEMAVGNMGSENKMNYTVMGNAVNLAARLEGVNKQYQSGIIISEFTKNRAGDAFLCRQLDRIRVVGINKPILIFELMGIADKAAPEEMAFLEKWKEAIAFFEGRNFSQAAELFSSLASQNTNDGAAALYKKRCDSFLKEPPTPEWDGVFTFSEK